MSVDPTQMSQPAGTQPSTPQGSVAPPQGVQGQAVPPGAGQQVQGQPAQNPQQPVAPETQPVSPPVPPQGPDPQRLREQAELAQYRQLMAGLAQQQQQAQADQQLEQQLAMIAATAENLPTSEANTYLKNQVKQLVARERMTGQQQVQQVMTEAQQRERMLAAPRYAAYLAETLQLTPEAKAELEQLGDPDIMHQWAPVIKQRYDAWNAQIASLQNGQVQQARSQEVQALTQAGLGAFGGQNVGGSFQVDIPDDLDADERAMAILAASEGRPGRYTVR